MSIGTALTRGALALLVAASLATAQEDPDDDVVDSTPGTLQTRKDRNQKSLSIRVHEAWLRETLDLDVRGAVQAYDRVQKTAPRNQPMRWIAVTRLAELQRMGIGGPEPLATPIDQAPPAVRDALQALSSPLPVDALLDDPMAAITFLALNPATSETQNWVREQLGSTLDARWLQNMATYRRWANSQPKQYWWATDILRAELRGRREQADALRKLYFANWQAPRLEGEPAAQLQVVRQRLDDWIADESISSRERWRLRRLAEELQKRGEQDSRGALEMVARLPTFAERLVGGEIPDTDSADPDESGGAPVEGGGERGR